MAKSELDLCCLEFLHIISVSQVAAFQKRMSKGCSLPAAHSLCIWPLHLKPEVPRAAISGVDPTHESAVSMLCTRVFVQFSTTATPVRWD